MMNDATYRILSGLFDAFLWGGELHGAENLPEIGPAVFVSNHLGAVGPIAVVASLPLRVHPWVVSDMMDWDKAADYLRMDFVEPQLHIPSPASTWVAKAISKISVRLLRSAGCIAVHQVDHLHETYKQSVDLLAEGKFILVFPEDPSQEIDPDCQMTSFKKGFSRLGEYYYKRTGCSLPFYPLAVHRESYRVKVGKPVFFMPGNQIPYERLRIKNVMEASIQEMYLEMVMNGFLGIPLRD